jgi:hypothetical protein
MGESSMHVVHGVCTVRLQKTRTAVGLQKTRTGDSLHAVQDGADTPRHTSNISHPQEPTLPSYHQSTMVLSNIQRPAHHFAAFIIRTVFGSTFFGCGGGAGGLVVVVVAAYICPCAACVSNRYRWSGSGCGLCLQLGRHRWSGSGVHSSFVLFSLARSRSGQSHADRKEHLVIEYS